VEFHPAKFSGTSVASIRAFVTVESFRSVVRGEDDQRVFPFTRFVDGGEEFAGGPVEVFDISEILGFIVILRPVLFIR